MKGKKTEKLMEVWDDNEDIHYHAPGGDFCNGVLYLHNDNVIVAITTDYDSGRRLRCLEIGVDMDYNKFFDYYGIDDEITDDKFEKFIKEVPTLKVLKENKSQTQWGELA